MASLRGLTVEAVEATLKEFDAIGPEAFLSKYKFGPPKACTWSATASATTRRQLSARRSAGCPIARALRASEFTGGMASVVRALEQLGYVVIDERPARNPRWAAEEIILALDLYLTHNQLDNQDEDVVELSSTLNALAIHSERPDAERWRNPNGVALKLANFAHLDPGYPGRGMASVSALDRIVFERLSPYPDLVSRLAADIRAGARVDLDNLPIAGQPTLTPTTPTLHPLRESPRHQFPSSNTTSWAGTRCRNPLARCSLSDSNSHSSETSATFSTMVVTHPGGFGTRSTASTTSLTSW